MWKEGGVVVEDAEWSLAKLALHRGEDEPMTMVIVLPQVATASSLVATACLNPATPLTAEIA